jgi:hypothetical protein
MHRWFKGDGLALIQLNCIRFNTSLNSSVPLSLSNNSKLIHILIPKQYIFTWNTDQNTWICNPYDDDDDDDVGPKQLKSLLFLGPEDLKHGYYYVLLNTNIYLLETRTKTNNRTKTIKILIVFGTRRLETRILLCSFEHQYIFTWNTDQNN